MSFSKVGSIFKKSITINLQPTEESFPELPDVLIWMRFILAAAYGIFLGLSPNLRGGIYILQALNLVTFVPVVYSRMYLNVPRGSFEGSIIFSGTFQAVAACLLIWMYFYTAANSQEEDKLRLFLEGKGAPEAEMDEMPLIQGVEF